VLLALTGPAIALIQVPVPDAGTAVLFTAALAGGSLAPALAGAAAMTSPVARFRRLDWLIVGVALATAVVVQGLLPAALFDPPAAGCFGCAHNLVEVHNDLSLYTRLGHWGLILTVVWGIGLALRAGWRWVSAPRVVRLVNAPMVVAGAAIAVVAAVAAIHSLSTSTPGIDSTLRTCWLLQCGLVLVMAFGVVVDGQRARGLTRRMTDDVLAKASDAETLRVTIAASIGDPSLRLVFLRDDGALIAADGSSIAETNRVGAVVRVNRTDSEIAEIWYDTRFVGASYQLVAVVRAAGLAIEHLAANARLLAELDDLAASRLRIIAAGDAERRRLERDLHDGAQQRLIALQIMLQIVGSHGSPELTVSYEAARREISTALEELRDLAHGIHPAALTDGGLGEGLRSLSETSPVPLIVDGSRTARHPIDAEAAAYRLVADTVSSAGKLTTSSAVTVTLGESEDVLRLRLRAEGVDASTGDEIMSRALDRILALDGSISVDATDEATIIEAMIPCVS
jgi:signal transduction histidine kinase